MIYPNEKEMFIQELFCPNYKAKFYSIFTGASPPTCSGLHEHTQIAGNGGGSEILDGTATDPGSQLSSETPQFP